MSQRSQNIDRTAERLAQQERELLAALHYELVGEIPRIEAYARQASEREKPRFQNERLTAIRYLNEDVPRRILWLSAAISFLQNAPVRERYEFVTGDFEQQDQIVHRLLHSRGFRDQHGVWIWIR